MNLRFAGHSFQLNYWNFWRSFHEESQRICFVGQRNSQINQHFCLVFVLFWAVGSSQRWMLSHVDSKSKAQRIRSASLDKSILLPIPLIFHWLHFALTARWSSVSEGSGTNITNSAFRFLPFSHMSYSHSSLIWFLIPNHWHLRNVESFRKDDCQSDQTGRLARSDSQDSSGVYSLSICSSGGQFSKCCEAAIPPTTHLVPVQIVSL